MSGARAVVEAHLEAVRAGDAVGMAAHYAPDAVLVRGDDRREGRSAIAAYFATVPARLAGGHVDVDIEDVDGDTVTIRWVIRGGPADGTRGHDVLTIGGDLIVHQTVHLDGTDF